MSEQTKCLPADQCHSAPALWSLDRPLVLGLGGNLVFCLKPPRHLVLPRIVGQSAQDEVTSMPPLPVCYCKE